MVVDLPQISGDSQMICGECGKELVSEFKFCPICGTPVRIPHAAIESQSSAHGIPVITESPLDHPAPASDDPRGTRVGVGTVVFGAFSALSLVVSIVGGIVPIYLLEAAAWAGAAWFWQRRKPHSEIAKGIVFFLALLVATGEIIQFAMPANSSTPHAPITSDAKSPDPFAKYAVPDGFVLECPTAIPSGTSSKPLNADALLKVVGTDGSLTSEQSYDSFYAPNGTAWNATLSYSNKSDSCVTMATVELELRYAGSVSRETHSIVFQPLLGAGEAQTVSVRLKIKTPEHGEDVALLGWRTMSASGFASGTEAPTYDQNGLQIVKDPKDPLADNGGNEINPPNPTNANGESPKAVSITADVAKRRLLQQAPPVYPPIAQAARVSGTVVLQATISRSGTVKELQVLSGPPMLQQAALDAVKSWRYKPYLVSSTAVEVQTQVIVVFSLGG
jgi:TonB family protein